MDPAEKGTIISMLGVYREEWKYRDDLFGKTFWRFAFLSLVIGFFPNLLENFNFSGEIPLLALPEWIFSAAGIIIAGFGFFIALNEMKRIEKLDDIYYSLIQELPKGYRIERIVQKEPPERERAKKIFHIKTNYLFCGMHILIALLIALNWIMGVFGH